MISPYRHLFFHSENETSLVATFAVENIVTALRDLSQFFSECELEYKYTSFGKTYVDGRTSLALKTLQAASTVETPTPTSSSKQRKDDKSADTADLARISSSFAQTLPWPARRASCRKGSCETCFFCQSCSQTDQRQTKISRFTLTRFLRMSVLTLPLRARHFSLH